MESGGMQCQYGFGIDVSMNYVHLPLNPRDFINRASNTTAKLFKGQNRVGYEIDF